LCEVRFIAKAEYRTVQVQVPGTSMSTCTRNPIIHKHQSFVVYYKIKLETRSSTNITMMQGPASDALERSFKRIKLDEQQISSSYIETAFSFHNVFDDIERTSCEYYDPFPTIGWNFDDESDLDTVPRPSPVASPASLSYSSSSSSSSATEGSKKRNHSCMVRSKTFAQNLCDLVEDDNTDSSFDVYMKRVEMASIPKVDIQCSNDTSSLSLEAAILCNNNTKCFSFGTSKLSRTSTKKNSFRPLSRLPSCTSLLTAAGGSSRLQAMARAL
jgi:hypothetical protein